MQEISPLKLSLTLLSDGERLPVLIDRQTGIPVRLGNRWAVRKRRFEVQLSTLVMELRVVSLIYEWATSIKHIDLDDYLLRGNLLSPQDIESLALFFRQSYTDLVSNSTYNRRLFIAKSFLKWCISPHNRGGRNTLSISEVNDCVMFLSALFASLHIPESHSPRIEPLLDSEIDAIRSAVKPIRHANGTWYPAIESIGRPSEQFYRDWLMFEVGLQLGLRRGEILKLQIEKSLPKGNEAWIKVFRSPDDPKDSRLQEPNVKTTERTLPASRNLLNSIRVYVTARPPVGRGTSKTPYLFITSRGNPVSLSYSDDIIQQIGRRAGIEPLSWHRLRHTWAEKQAEKLLDVENGIARLMYLGGWSTYETAKHYIQNALQRKSIEAVSRYHDELSEDIDI